MIEFVNVKSGERRKVNTEPMIAAYYNSSDQHVNAKVGQDFGWRLSPQTIKQLRDIKKNGQKMNEIAATFQLPLDGIGDTDILRWISLEDARANQGETLEQESDYERQYDEELRLLERTNKVENDPNPSQPAGADKLVPRETEHEFSENDKIEKPTKANNKEK